MKKLLLFISLVSVINAESKMFEGIDLEKIAKESAERTNLNNLLYIITHHSNLSFLHPTLCNKI